MLVLDIYCQQLGDICITLKVGNGGVCAPFGHRVGKYRFCNIYTYWRYAANNLGMIESLIYVSVLDI